MKLRLEADLDLDYSGHRFRLQTASPPQAGLELLIPSLGAAAALAKFALSLSVDAERLESLLVSLGTPLSIRFKGLTLATLGQGQPSAWSRLLSALQKL